MAVRDVVYELIKKHKNGISRKEIIQKLINTYAVATIDRAIYELKLMGKIEKKGDVFKVKRG